METIEVSTRKYKASDGVVFDRRCDCEEHEEAIKDNNSGVMFYMLNGSLGGTELCKNAYDAHFIITYGPHGYDKLLSALAELGDAHMAVKPKYENTYCAYWFDGDLYKYVPFLYDRYYARGLAKMIEDVDKRLAEMYKKGEIV